MKRQKQYTGALILGVMPSKTTRHLISKLIPHEIPILLESIRLRTNGHPGIGNPLSLLDVPPDNIRWHISTSDIGKNFPKTALISDGDWDKKCTIFDKNPIYRAFIEHFKHGVPWEETETFEAVFGNQNNWEKDAEFYDNLYIDIKHNGYRTQSERSPFAKLRKPVLPEIQICIGRDGRIIEKHGQHRLAIAKILDLESVPVWVRIRHVQWQAIRDRVWNAESIDDLDQEAKDNLSHPDIKHIL